MNLFPAGFLIKRIIRKASFPFQAGVAAAKTTRQILEAFEAGCALALQTPEADLSSAVFRVPWYLRDFFWEGAAVGSAARYACTFRREGNPDSHRAPDGYRKMQFTGYGFWNGVAARYKLPAVPVQPVNWQGVDDFLRYKPFIFGGAAFSTVVSEGAFNPKSIKTIGPQSMLTPILHGCGRALWFLHMDNIASLSEVAMQHDEWTEPILEGVGVAIGFTQINNPEHIAATLSHFYERSRLYVLRGIAVALVELSSGSPEALTALNRIPEKRITNAFHRCRDALLQAKDGAGWYDSYLASLRLNLSRTYVA